MKEEEAHATLVGGRFNDQRNLPEACRGGPKRSRSSHTPARILRPPREDFTGLSHLSSPESLSKTVLSQGCTLGSISYCENSGQTAHSKTGRGAHQVGSCWYCFRSSVMSCWTKTHSLYSFIFHQSSVRVA